MKKAAIFFLILILSPVIGGIYGIVHDQITYSLSPEYYTKFKFIQFPIAEWGLGSNVGDPELPEIRMESPRIGAGIVGFMATWWMGLLIGVFIGIMGFFYPTHLGMFRSFLKSIGIVLGVALFTAFLGWVYGYFFMEEIPEYWFLPANVMDIRSFVAVGSMHNFSYLGGLIGMTLAVLVGIRGIIRERRLSVNA